MKNDLTWTRDDEGDITSKEQADQLMFKYNAELQPFWTIRRVAWDYSAFEKMWRAESRTEIVYNFITKHYYANLIKDLREQYAMISSSSLVVEV